MTTPWYLLAASLSSWRYQYKLAPAKATPETRSFDITFCFGAYLVKFNLKPLAFMFHVKKNVMSSEHDFEKREVRTFCNSPNHPKKKKSTQKEIKENKECNRVIRNRLKA